MTLARFSIYCLAFVTLCVLGAGFYVYQNFSVLAQEQALKMLRAQGVERVEVLRPKFSSESLQIASLELEGVRDGLPFFISLQSLMVTYNWDSLLARRVRTVSIDALQIALDESPSSSPASSPAELQPLDLNELRPRELLAAMPAASIDIQAWEFTQQFQNTPIRVTGSLLWDTDLSLHANSNHLGLQISAQLSSTPVNELTLELNATSAAEKMVEFVAKLEKADKERWRWQLNGEVAYAPVLEWLREDAVRTSIPQLSALPSEFALTGSSTFTSELSHATRIAPQADVIIEEMLGKVSLQNTIGSLRYDEIIRDIATEVEATVSISTGIWSLSLAPFKADIELASAGLGMPPENQKALGWEAQVPLRVVSKAASQLTWNAREVKGQVQLEDWSIKLGTSHNNIRLDSLNINAQGGSSASAKLEVAADGTLKTRLSKQVLPALAVATRIEGVKEDLDIKLQFTDIAQSLSAQLAGRLDTTTGKGKFTLAARSLDLPYATGAIMPILQEFEVLTQSLETSSGEVRWESEISTNGFDINNVRQTSKLELTNVSGLFEEYRFEGLVLKAQWSGVQKWQTKKPVKLSLQRLDLGFEVSDLQVAVNLPKPISPGQPNIYIDSLSARMFGGTVMLSEPGYWDFAAPRNAMTLRASNWQLTELVALQQGQDIKAKGVLEGELPIVMADGRVSIEKGFLRALPPGGSIRYVPNESSRQLAASNEELGLALDLLDDFRFEVLSSDVALDKDGQLVFGLALSGRNPSQHNGRKINFNINLEQNIDPLLQSLRLDDKLIEKLERRQR